MKRICIIGCSGKLGQYMTEHALARGYEVHGVCRPESVGKMKRWGDRVKLFPARTDDVAVVSQAIKGCDGVLTVLAPWGVNDYASGTARAVLENAEPHARLIFSCGWHISRDGKDRYPWKIHAILKTVVPLARLFRLVDVADQYRAADLIFKSDTDWTLVRGSNLEEGESEGLPVWAERAQDPLLASNMTRRTDFALFMVHALTDDRLIQQAPAICSRASKSARAHVPEAA